MDVLVLGATGTVGRRLTALLRGSGHDVREGSRTGTPPFDWGESATWGPVLDGVTRLYLLAPDGVPVDPRFVELAVSCGVTRIVLQSSGAIEVMGDDRLLAAERIVRAAGAGWTILRPGWFAQNFDEGFFRDAVLAGEVTLPVGTVKQPFVDADDIAAVAFAALIEDGHTGQTYEVTGPEAVTFDEAVAAVARAAGRPVRFDGTAEGYVAAQQSFGRSAEEVEGEVAAFTALAAAGDATVTDVVLRVAGRPPKPFETYAAEAAARGAWQD